MHVCVCVRSSEWPGLNSAKTARQFNISREAQMCQSEQRGLRRSHNFICQMSMKLNDFWDILLNTSILYPLKIDWKRCHAMTRGVRRNCIVWKVKSLYMRREKTTTGLKSRAASSHRETITVHKSLLCEPQDGKSHMLCSKDKLWRKALKKAKIKGWWSTDALFTQPMWPFPYLIRRSKGTEWGNAFIFPPQDRAPYLAESLPCHLLENVDMSHDTISLDMMQCNRRPYRVNINGKWTAFMSRFSTLTDGQSAFTISPLMHSHSHADGSGAAIQGAGLHFRSNSGFNVLLKDTSTHGQEEPVGKGKLCYI